MNTVAVPASRTTNAHAHHQTSSSRCATSTISRARTIGDHAERADPGVVRQRGLAGHRLQEPAGRRSPTTKPKTAQSAACGVQHSSQERHRGHLRRLGRGLRRLGRIREPRKRPREQSRPLPPRDPGTAKDVRHAARTQGRGDRARLRHAAAPVPRPHRRDPQHPQAHGRRHARRPRQHHAADHRPRVGLRHDRQDPRPARASTASATARTTPTTACPSRPRGSIKEPAVWDKLGEQGMRSLLIGVPPGFPPPKEFPGWRVGCFLTPPQRRAVRVSRRSSRSEIAEELGGPGNYIFDIPNFREQGMDFVLDQVFKMTERRFQVARRLVKNKPWDYFMMVEMGAGPAPPRVLAVLRPAPSAVRAGQRVRDRVPGLLPLPGPARSARCWSVLPDDAITIVMSRPRRASDDGRPLLQRLADAGGLPRDDRDGHRAHADREGADRLEPHDRVGRRRLLRPLLPQREGPRAAGHRRARASTKRSATS